MKYLFPLALLLISCGTSGADPDHSRGTTEGVIPREIMIRILVDAHLAEAAMILQRNEGKEDSALVKHYYDGIFSKYKISREKYNVSLEYYRKNPEEFSKMYEKVIYLISERQKNYTPKNKPN